MAWFHVYSTVEGDQTRWTWSGSVLCHGVDRAANYYPSVVQ